MGGIEREEGVVEVESEGGEKFCDTCVLVDSVPSSSVAWGASVWREWKEEYWLWSSPGGRIFSPPFPGGCYLKTLRLGVCAWCGLILFGELMVQFSLRPGSQL